MGGYVAMVILWPRLSSQSITSKEVFIFGEEDEPCDGYDARPQEVV